ncbi:hypothetical protein ACFYO1_11545 [Nocardia sp. NPDC006044]|uniref:hypothetical protein n=1 Tax=Nocardia sp. NPDC006044 TaxID=3364306 RepID=UPI0036CFFB6B
MDSCEHENDRVSVQGAHHGDLAARSLRASERTRSDPSFRRPLEPEQYTSIKFTESLAVQGLSASIGSVDDAYDNALAESIIGLFQTEVVNRHGPFKTISEVEYALME